ncbi:MAG: Maf family nucleotide pyrophosphatase [Muribaculaceae bacterium]|nr:Maf family nucleotide pyrophosphatase [Muribaculaceae bacterium]
MLENLNRYSILLASKSPRRRELLKMLDIPFTIAQTVEVDETYPADLSPEQVPLYLSRLKAEAYSSLIKSNELIITADTIVINNGKILGKPKSEEQAKCMLREMSGHEHTVISGVSITTADKQVSFDTHTEVLFAPLTDEDINYYVEHYHPMDKAGAYGIQEWIGAVAVCGIQGSFYNVMGLPIHQLYCKLREL